MAHVQDNLRQIRQEIADCATAAGRSPVAVRLIAVSKRVDDALVDEAYADGQRSFGENQVQELARKALALPTDIEWHMIGHLQTNKAKTAVTVSALIHSVDSVKLARRIDDAARDLGQVQNLLIQVNVSGEASKSGVDTEPLAALLDAVVELEFVSCKGFMTMAPHQASSSELRHLFARLRGVRDRSETQCGRPFPELSMGMSGDFREAIQEGATMVRVGTAIFGARERV